MRFLGFNQAVVNDSIKHWKMIFMNQSNHWQTQKTSIRFRNARIVFLPMFSRKSGVKRGEQVKATINF